MYDIVHTILPVAMVAYTCQHPNQNISICDIVYLIKYFGFDKIKILKLSKLTNYTIAFFKTIQKEEYPLLLRTCHKKKSWKSH